MVACSEEDAQNYHSNLQRIAQNRMEPSDKQNVIARILAIAQQENAQEETQANLTQNQK